MLVKNLYRFCQLTKYEYLYGINPVLSALYANRRNFYKLIVSNSDAIHLNSRITNIINEAKKINIPIIFSGRPKMDSLVQGQPHQNVLLQCQTLKHSIFDQVDHSRIRHKFISQITDPQNFGAILRSCFYFGIKGVIVAKNNTAPLNSTVSKASAGALQFMDVKVIRQKQEPFLISWKEKEGIILSTSSNTQNGYIPVHKLKNGLMGIRNKKILLIIGSEGQGVSPHIANHANYFINIQKLGLSSFPYSFIDSLNVSAAVTTILFELTRQ